MQTVVLNNNSTDTRTNNSGKAKKQQQVISSLPPAQQKRAKARALRKRYEDLLQAGRDDSGSNVDKYLFQLRQLVLVEGLPKATKAEQEGCTTTCSLRARVWKILLRIKTVDANKYLEYVARGPFKGKDSPEYQQIRKDTRRTFPTLDDFRAKVPEAKLSRVLNVLLHACSTYPEGLNNPLYCSSFWISVYR